MFDLPKLKPKSAKQLLTSIATIYAFYGMSTANAATPAAFYESRNDHYRTGANLNETILNTSNVNSSNFGLLFTLPINSSVVNQTLYAPQVNIKGIIHNVIIVTTLSGTVYCFDADKPGPALWIVFLTGNIQSTPLIDPNTNTLYLVNRKSVPVRFVFLLHALDLTTGAEKFGGPTLIDATYSDPTHTYTVNFNDHPILQQHSGLALVNGRLILGFAGDNEDLDSSYRGWVLSYDAKTLKQTGAFATVTTPETTGASVWQSGRGPVVDDENNVYLFTANSFVPDPDHSNAYLPPFNYSESLLKFNFSSPSTPGVNDLKIADSFTPSAWANLDIADNDLSGSGPILIPGTSYLIGGGKDGISFVWNKNNLGGLVAKDTQVQQKFALNPNPAWVYSGPVFWSRSDDQGGSIMYNVYQDAPIYGFKYNGPTHKFNTNPFTNSSVTEPVNTGYRNAIGLSANGGQSGTGIIWELQNDPNGGNSVLRAFDAENLANELWNSSEYLSDSLAGNNLYIPPTVVNGKVYTNTFDKQIAVYGLINTVITQKHTYITKPGNPIREPVIATNSNGEILTYSATDLPPGLKIDATTGIISGAPTTPGNYNVVISVSDSKQAPQTMSFIWKISSPPTITTAFANTTVSTKKLTTVAMPVTATDDGGFPFYYKATGLPAGTWMSTPSGLIKGTPTQLGNFQVTVTVGNQNGQTSSFNFEWVITK